MSFWLNIAWNWHFYPPQREATTTNMGKKRIILESSRKLANQLKQPKHDYEFGKNKITNGFL
jgi:hypothetical protein